ncbi:MAG: hypothetical protein NTW29_08560 [Bacteroidetes bacterium]|nr:hypothetical protein [Bacteroidota bacterium]
MRILLFCLFILFFAPSFLFANNAPVYYQTTKKWGPFCYIRVEKNTAIVFTMGSYLDKAGSGHAIRGTDTLIQTGDQSFSGKMHEVKLAGGKPIITLRTGKKKVYDIVPSENLSTVYLQLNNAYFLDHFFAQCDSLNKKYPLNHFSFRNGFRYWEEMSGKNTTPEVFQPLADKKLRFVWDSVTQSNEYRLALSNQLIARLPEISYSSLKDSLQLFPFATISNNHYLRNVLRQCSMLQPEYFFRLSEDFKQFRSQIFLTADVEESTISKLKAVPGHEYAKKDFFKQLRFIRSLRK